MTPPLKNPGYAPDYTQQDNERRIHLFPGRTQTLHDRKTEHFKAIMSNCHASAIADHVTSTGHNLRVNVTNFQPGREIAKKQKI